MLEHLIREDLGDEHFSVLWEEVLIYTALIFGFAAFSLVFARLNLGKTICLTAILTNVALITYGFKHFNELLFYGWNESVPERAFQPHGSQFLTTWMFASDFVNIILEVANGSLSLVFLFHHLCVFIVSWCNMNQMLTSMVPYFGALAHVSTIFSWLRDPRLNMKNSAPKLYDCCTYIFATTFILRCIFWVFFSIPFLEEVYFIVTETKYYTLALLDVSCWLALTLLQIHWLIIIIKRLNKLCSSKPSRRKQA